MTDLGFIVKMVIYKCRELGNPVTETLAAYVAQTSLNPGKSEIRRVLIFLIVRRLGTFLFGEVDQSRRGNGFG